MRRGRTGGTLRTRSTDDRIRRNGSTPSADVVIVGGGITGTVAALKLARAGAQVIVVDAQAIGEGAARRNAGFIGRTLKRSVAWLEARRGAGHGVRVYRELDEALDSVRALVEEEGIACHHRICGRFIAANSPAHYAVADRRSGSHAAAAGFSL